MTLHVVYDHQCSDCGAFYIPFDTDVPCPRCGLLEDERIDFITRAVESMRFNKRTTGFYVPGAWLVDSLGDHVLYLVFHVFDAFDESDDQGDFGTFASDHLASRDWGDEGYLEGHVRSIALRIHEVLARL